MHLSAFGKRKIQKLTITGNIRGVKGEISEEIKFATSVTSIKSQKIGEYYNQNDAPSMDSRLT